MMVGVCADINCPDISARAPDVLVIVRPEFLSMPVYVPLKYQGKPPQTKPGN